MCWYVYIATSKPLTNVLFTEQLVPSEQPPPLHFQMVAPDDEYERGNLCRHLFSQSNLYYVGSSSGCSCHFTHTAMDFDDQGNTTYYWDDSARELLDFIQAYTQEQPLEMYAVWEEEWDLGLADQPLERVEIAVNGLTMDDYFDLTSRRFYTFKYK